jgi:hypothetical protein
MSFGILPMGMSPVSSGLYAITVILSFSQKGSRSASMEREVMLYLNWFETSSLLGRDSCACIVCSTEKLLNPMCRVFPVSTSSCIALMVSWMGIRGFGQCSW